MCIRDREVHGHGPMSDVSIESVELGNDSDAIPSEREREVLWPGGARNTPVFDASRLKPGWEVAGPAILEFPDTTVLVGPGDSAVIHGTGSVLLTVGGK